MCWQRNNWSVDVVEEAISDKMDSSGDIWQK